FSRLPPRRSATRPSASVEVEARTSLPFSSSRSRVTATPAAGRPATVSSTWVLTLAISPSPSVPGCPIERYRVFVGLRNGRGFGRSPSPGIVRVLAECSAASRQAAQAPGPGRHRHETILEGGRNLPAADQPPRRVDSQGTVDHRDRGPETLRSQSLH